MQFSKARTQALIFSQYCAKRCLRKDAFESLHYTVHIRLPQHLDSFVVKKEINMIALISLTLTCNLTVSQYLPTHAAITIEYGLTYDLNPI